MIKYALCSLAWLSFSTVAMAQDAPSDDAPTEETQAEETQATDDTGEQDQAADGTPPETPTGEGTSTDEDTEEEGTSTDGSNDEENQLTDETSQSSPQDADVPATPAPTDTPTPDIAACPDVNVEPLVCPTPEPTVCPSPTPQPTPVCPTPAPAVLLIDASDHMNIADAITAAGFDNTIIANADGPVSITITAAGVPTSLFLNACDTDDACGIALFSAGFDTGRRNRPSADTIAAWNAKTVMTKAFVDEDGDPYLHMAINLKHGVSSDNFADTLTWWDAAVAQFMIEIDF